MGLDHRSFQRNLRSKDQFDIRLDKWIETGRQFVDGVSGNRPGRRKPIQPISISSSSFDNVGRWVGDKIDWLLEDEDDWLEPWQSKPETTSNTAKRPLKAISRRLSHPNPGLLNISDTSEAPLRDEDQWPEEESFRVERWSRDQVNENTNSSRETNSNRNPKRTDRRSLPRSSRRRN